MRYQIVKFEYKYFKRSRAQVIHQPNWFEKLFGKTACMVEYQGWVDYWTNMETFQKAPYTLRCMLLKEWHNNDLDYFKKEIAPRISGVVKTFIQLLIQRHADNN